MTHKALHIPTRCYSYHIRPHHPCHGHESTNSGQTHGVHHWNHHQGHIHGWCRLCTKFNTRLARSPFRALRCLQTCRIYRLEGWVSPWDHAHAYPTHSQTPADGSGDVHESSRARFSEKRLEERSKTRPLQLKIS